MLTQEELGQIKATINLLNNHLQQIGGYANRSVILTKDSPVANDYVRNIVESNNQASELVVELLEKIYGLVPSAVPAVATPFSPESTARLHIAGLTSPPADSSQNSAGKRLVVAPPDPDVPIENHTGLGELIMIVDDDDHVLLLAKMMLIEAGYRVIAAANGVEALRIFEKVPDQISLIILDFSMPIMDGAEVFEEIRAIRPRAKVLLSSGFAEQGRLNQMLSRGLRGFIPKPYTMEKMLLQVRSALDSGS